MFQSYNVIKIALGIRMYPELKAKELAKTINVSLKSIYTLYSEAEMYSRCYIPNLVTKEQLRELSGSDLTVLYYLYTAEKGKKREFHLYELNIAERTFRKSLTNLRKYGLIKDGIQGKINNYTVNPVSEPFQPILN
jgi:predicted transcriptional regulator